MIDLDAIKARAAARKDGPADVRALVTEVERLRAEVAHLRLGIEPGCRLTHVSATHYRVDL